MSAPAASAPAPADPVAPVSAVHVHPDDVPAGRGSSRYPDAFRAAYAVRELVGPDAPLADASVRVGTVSLPAGFVYPPHRHPAAEVYVVIAGELTWSVDGVSFAARPGSVVRHPPHAVHAMTVLPDAAAELVWLWYPAGGDPDGVLGTDAEPVGDWAATPPG